MLTLRSASQPSLAIFHRLADLVRSLEIPHINLEKAEQEGAIRSGDLERVAKLRRGIQSLQHLALRVAPLPVVELLFDPEKRLSGNTFISWFLPSSPDPRVLPWCHAHGLELERVDIWDSCASADKLENLLYLRSVLPSSEGKLKQSVRAGYSKFARRVLRCFFLEEKLDFDIRNWEHFSFFESAPSYLQAFELLLELGLLERVRLALVQTNASLGQAPRTNPFYLVPDLAYLKLLKKTLVDWDIAEDDKCLERLISSRRFSWHPHMESCVLWLIEQGAPLTAPVLAFFIAPIYRLSFFMKLLDLGCPATSDAYLALKEAIPRDFSERYWLLRRAKVPVDDGFLAVCCPNRRSCKTISPSLIGPFPPKPSSRCSTPRQRLWPDSRRCSLCLRPSARAAISRLPYTQLLPFARSTLRPSTMPRWTLRSLFSTGSWPTAALARSSLRRTGSNSSQRLSDAEATGSTCITPRPRCRPCSPGSPSTVAAFPTLAPYLSPSGRPKT